jgi:hypothetical protein
MWLKPRNCSGFTALGPLPPLSESSKSAGYCLQRRIRRDMSSSGKGGTHFAEALIHIRPHKGCPTIRDAAAVVVVRVRRPLARAVGVMPWAGSAGDVRKNFLA